MRILFLGGTSFVGRHIAEAALAAGHRLVFFHRGKTNPSLFSTQEHRYGDRYGSLEALSGVEADVVIDTSGFTPDAVRASAIAVASRAERYVFMSSINAYDLSVAQPNETSRAMELPPDASMSEPSDELYGALKVAAERALVEVLGPERVIGVRAGLMIGPHDATDRFTYWPARIARGGRVLAPRGPTMPIQVIDVRDVADWVVANLASDIHGVYGLVGDPEALAMGDVVAACRDASHSDARITWVSDDFLTSNDVGAWVELPLWLPQTSDTRGLLNVRNERAKSTGLTLRPLARSVRDILEELRTRVPERAMRAGLSPEREAALLARWDAL